MTSAISAVVPVYNSAEQDEVIAAALVARSNREQLAVGSATCVASIGNAFVYPFALPRYAVTWPLSSAVLVGVGFALTFWLARRAASAAATSPAESATM